MGGAARSTRRLGDRAAPAAARGTNALTTAGESERAPADAGADGVARRTHRRQLGLAIGLLVAGLAIVVTVELLESLRAETVRIRVLPVAIVAADGSEDALGSSQVPAASTDETVRRIEIELRHTYAARHYDPWAKPVVSFVPLRGVDGSEHHWMFLALLSVERADGGLAGLLGRETRRGRYSVEAPDPMRAPPWPIDVEMHILDRDDGSVVARWVATLEGPGHEALAVRRPVAAATPGRD